jgi:hypothetical protein
MDTPKQRRSPKTVDAPQCPGTILNNIVLLCKSCNSSKGKKLPETWLAQHYEDESVKMKLQAVDAYFEYIHQLKEE